MSFGTQFVTIIPNWISKLKNGPQLGIVLCISVVMIAISLINLIVVGVRRFRDDQNKCSTVLMKVIPVSVLINYYYY